MKTAYMTSRVQNSKNKDLLQVQDMSNTETLKIPLINNKPRLSQFSPISQQP